MKETKKNVSAVLITLLLIFITVRSFAVPANGSLSDKNIKYFGRWDFSSSTHYTSYWGGAYIKVKFTGTTVKVRVGNNSDFYAKIDGGPWVGFHGVQGTIDLTPIALRSGIHDLSVAQGKDYDYLFSFQGLVIDPGAYTKSPEANKKLIEYIGDSITAGYTDPQANLSAYGWIFSEKIHAEHTQIAYPGLNLTSGSKGKTGMDAQYFKQRSTGLPESPDWDFKAYTPSIIVINLGTNDDTNQVADSLFEFSYTLFLKNIRSRFPKADIYVLRTFLGLKTAPTIAAVNSRKAAGDRHVNYVDTEGWLRKGSDDYTDNVHPSVTGNRKVAEKLALFIK